MLHVKYFLHVFLQYLKVYMYAYDLKIFMLIIRIRLENKEIWLVHKESNYVSYQNWSIAQANMSYIKLLHFLK